LYGQFLRIAKASPFIAKFAQGSPRNHETELPAFTSSMPAIMNPENACGNDNEPIPDKEWFYFLNKRSPANGD